jgi:hypothetical protein
MGRKVWWGGFVLAKYWPYVYTYTQIYILKSFFWQYWGFELRVSFEPLPTALKIPSYILLDLISNMCV